MNESKQNAWDYLQALCLFDIVSGTCQMVWLQNKATFLALLVLSLFVSLYLAPSK